MILNPNTNQTDKIRFWAVQTNYSPVRNIVLLPKERMKRAAKTKIKICFPIKKYLYLNKNCSKTSLIYQVPKEKHKRKAIYMVGMNKDNF